MAPNLSTLKNLANNQSFVIAATGTVAAASIILYGLQSKRNR